MEKKTKEDWVWRFKLKKGDKIDCCNPMDVWYRSTVLDCFKCGGIDSVKVAFRIEREGDWAGLPKKYDEVLSAASIRI